MSGEDFKLTNAKVGQITIVGNVEIGGMRFSVVCPPAGDIVAAEGTVTLPARMAAQIEIAMRAMALDELVERWQKLNTVARLKTGQE